MRNLNADEMLQVYGGSIVPSKKCDGNSKKDNSSKCYSKKYSKRSHKSYSRCYPKAPV